MGAARATVENILSLKERLRKKGLFPPNSYLKSTLENEGARTQDLQLVEGLRGMELINEMD